MNTYEGIFIFRPDLEESRLEEEYSKVETTLKKHEAAVEKTERWGKKRLTYEIDSFREGFFLYLVFNAMPDKIKVFTDLFKIDNNILRSMITRKES